MLSAEAPDPRLYSPNHISLAAFLGSPLAGALLMALNYRRVGLRPAATRAALLGLAATAVLMPLAMVLPDWIPGPVLPIAYVLSMRQLAMMIQRSRLTPLLSQLQPEAPPVSWGKAAGVGLGCLVVVFGGVVGLAMAWPESKLAYGKAEIHFGDGASEADARRVGGYLEQIGVAHKNEFSVHLARQDKILLVKFVITSKEAREDPRTAAAYQDLANKLSSEVFEAAPVQIQLCNEYLMVKKKISDE